MKNEFKWTMFKQAKIRKRGANSEGSQFHHPPQVPSCSAHQPPKIAVNNKLLNAKYNKK
jgi:hypothetical protein